MKYNIMFASHPDYSGNAKALYEYVKKSRKDCNTVWVSYEDDTYIQMKLRNINCVRYDTKDFYEAFDKTNIVIFTHDELIKLKKENQIYIYLDHGKGCKKIGYFLNKKNMAFGDFEYLNKMYDSVDYIICSSALCKLFYHVAYDISMDRVLDIGTPRTDFLYQKDCEKKIQKLCDIDLKKFSKIILYLPTIRNGIGRNNDGNFNNNILNLENYDDDLLNEYLKKHNYLLIIKFHPFEKNVKKKENYSNIIYINEELSKKNLISLPEYISTVDLIIGDYSSAHIDYLILDKPICFLCNDIEEYSLNRGILLDNFNFWFPGPLIKTFENLKVEIDNLIKNKDYYSKERKMFVDLMFYKTKKDNCKRFCQYFFDKKRDILEESRKLKSKEYRKICENKIQELQLKNEKIEELKYLNEELKQRLFQLENSKGWKIIEKIRKIKNKILYVIK